MKYLHINIHLSQGIFYLHFPELWMRFSCSVNIVLKVEKRFRGRKEINAGFTRQLCGVGSCRDNTVPWKWRGAGFVEDCLFPATKNLAVTKELCLDKGNELPTIVQPYQLFTRGYYNNRVHGGSLRLEAMNYSYIQYPAQRRYTTCVECEGKPNLVAQSLGAKNEEGSA